MSSPPTAHVERVKVFVGEQFPLGWNDRVLKIAFDGDAYELTILRRPN